LRTSFFRTITILSFFFLLLQPIHANFSKFPWGILRVTTFWQKP
jgi:hypothetical protein